MVYPTLQMDNATSFNTMLQFGNSVVGGWLGLGLLFMVFGISFLGSPVGYGFDKRLLASLFVTTLLSVLFVAIGIVNYLVVPVLAVLLVAVWFFTREGAFD